MTYKCESCKKGFYGPMLNEDGLVADVVVNASGVEAFYFPHGEGRYGRIYMECAACKHRIVFSTSIPPREADENE